MIKIDPRNPPNRFRMAKPRRNTRACATSSPPSRSDRQDARMTIDAKYLIVGGGMTADAACRGIREHDPDGSIGVVGAEPIRPTSGRRSRRGSGRAATRNDLARHRGDGRRSPARPHDRRARPRRASRPTTRARATATRSCCSRPAAARDGSPCGDGRCHLLPHARGLPAAARGRRATAPSFVVIGGGFIGSEIAAALDDERLRT